MKTFFKNNKKGYTLIEVIVCVLLIALIGTVFTMTMSKKKENTTTQVQEKQKEELEIAVDVLASKMDSSQELIQYISNNSDDEIIKKYCLKKSTILSSGLVENNSILNNMSDDKYLLVQVDKAGTREIKYDATEEECSYLSSSVNDDNVEIEDFSTDKYKLKPTICKKNSETQTNCENADDSSDSVLSNQYLFNMNFEYNYVQTISIPLPSIYTIFLIDNSGSMSGAQYTNAVSATKNLAEKLVERNSKTPVPDKFNYVSVVKFNSSASTLQGFTKNEINSLNFGSATGGTNYSSAFSKATSLINSIDVNERKESRFFVIFLTDGGSSGYATSLATLNNALSYDGKEIGKIIAIDYENGASNLKTIASYGCPNSGYLEKGKNKCYIASNTDNIYSKFEELYTTIESETVKSTYKGLKVTITPSDYFDFYDKNGNKMDTIIFNKDWSDLGTAEENINTVIQLNDLYTIELKTMNVAENLDGESFPLMKNIKIELFGYESKDNSSQKITDGLPSIVLNVKRNSIIN